ncbi:emp24/gp25L/p24 family/GOLD-domain-containing protein [Schizophyllum fasciatum]
MSRPFRTLPSLFGIISALLFLLPAARATAFTTTIGANERLCFYADVDKPKEKIGFYFAVQAGGSFDINYEVTNPAGKARAHVLLGGKSERQGDYVLTANTVGEYSFCFENDMSTLTEKLIDFDIMVESEPRKEAPAKPGQISEHSSPLEESIFRLNGMLMNIKRTQKHFHTRERRGFSIVESTQNKLFWYAVFESLGIVGMAIFQVYVLQTFFTKTGRKYNV